MDIRRIVYRCETEATQFAVRTGTEVRDTLEENNAASQKYPKVLDICTHNDYVYVSYCKYVANHNATRPERSGNHRSSRSRFSALP